MLRPACLIATMLIHTFCHIPRVGTRAEHRLWNAGIHTWDDLSSAGPEALAGTRAADAEIDRFLDQSRIALATEDPAFFAHLLPGHLHWRLYPDFQDSVAYLDIETTGTNHNDHVTTIALYDGRTIRFYVHGYNMHEFPDDLARYKVLVTYNGKQFDVPYLERAFRIRIPQVHIDLRFVLASMGYTGGLKGCEKQLGIDRGQLDGVNGYFAVLLWREFRKTGNARALETLLSYNIADTVNLAHLMIAAYNQKLATTPFDSRRCLEAHDAPPSPFIPDPDVLAKLMPVYKRHTGQA
jgi:uncharacterized protein YprB with RNaseH-like and TPR domain